MNSEHQTKLRWGILATGNIARKFAKGVEASQSGESTAVGSRTMEKAESFGDEFGIENRYGSYYDLLASPEFEAVYIAPPHPFHAQWAIRAAECGKHILCEKPLTMNHAEAMAVVEAARENRVFLMEAFHYRCHPQTAKILEIIREGTIGEVRSIDASFSFHTKANLESRFLNHELGGGGILDVGCYTVSMVRLIVGAALGQGFVNPLKVEGAGFIGSESRVDEFAEGLLTFPENILAHVATGVRLLRDNTLLVFGTEGWIHVPAPWQPTREGGNWSLEIHVTGEPGERLVTGSSGDLFAIEVDCVAANLENREAPTMTGEDSLGNMQTLDHWRDAIGMTYDWEKVDYPLPPVHGKPLSRRPATNMTYGSIQAIEKPISRLVMGVDNQETLPHASVMFDDFYERGGNCFDVAWAYGGGKREKLLGQWIHNRCLREELVIITKGGHSPLNFPEHVTPQLMESLDRLKTDTIDIYFLHRDNPLVPVSEFVDVLNEHFHAGRIRCFGGSNWAIQRVEEANAYARANGLQKFTVFSNNLSLARMVDPVWKDCLSVSDSESRAWLKEQHMTLFPWSSQARGFFTDRAGTDKRNDPELVRCWYSDDNFDRRRRAVKLALEKGVEPINIALAYVLCQPFPTFPLIGPRQLSETRSSFGALPIELTDKELRFLNLEEDHPL